MEGIGEGNCSLTRLILTAFPFRFKCQEKLVRIKWRILN